MRISARIVPLGDAQRPAVPPSAAEYVHARETATLEPPELRGLVYLQDSSGQVQVLKHSGETRPDVPPGAGPDVPESAVRDGRVVFHVDGIGQEWSEQQRQIHYFLHGHSPDGIQAGQPIVGIHEGSGRSTLHDGTRIARDLSYLKMLQLGFQPAEWANRRIYRIDPAVKALHDEVRQSLEAGRKVDVVTHSGGGAEAALALTILSKEEDGRYRQAVSDSVRVISTASAAAREDFLQAGVRAENLFYTGSNHDPVYRILRHYIHPVPLWPTNLLPIGEAVLALYRQLTEGDAMPYHSPDYIFAYNHRPDGSHRIGDFLAGGPGGDYPLP